MRGISRQVRAFISAQLVIVMLFGPAFAYGLAPGQVVPGADGATVSGENSVTPSPSVLGTDAVALDSSQTPVAGLFGTPPVAVSGKSMSTEVGQEDVSKRTPVSCEYVLSDGRRRVEYFGHPVNFFNPSTGRLDRIDSTLVERQEGTRTVSVNRANSFRVRIPARLANDWVSAETTGVSVAMRPSWMADNSSKSRSRAAAVVSRSNNATDRVFSRAFDDADVEYESVDAGLKERIVVSQPTSATAWEFDLKVTGAAPVLNADGTISITASGEATPTFTIPAPSMWDAGLERGTGTVSNDVHYELARSGDAYKLRVVADAGWINDPERQFPVTVDPTVITGTPVDTFVSSKDTLQNTNFSGNTLLWVTNHSPKAAWSEWTYIQPSNTMIQDLRTKTSDGYVADAATANLYMYSPNSGQYIHAYRTVGDVYTSSVTWASRCPSYVYLNSSIWPAGGWNTWDVTEALIAWQSSMPARNEGFTIMLAGEPGVQVGYQSAEWSTKPIFAIEYMQRPVITLTSPLDGEYTQRPDVTWTYESDRPQAAWQVNLRRADTGQILSSAAGTDSSKRSTPLPLPSGGLPAGTYQVELQTNCNATARLPVVSSNVEYAEFDVPVRTMTSKLLAPELVNPVNAIGGVPVVDSSEVAWDTDDNYTDPQIAYQLELTDGAGPAVVNPEIVSSATTASVPTPAGGWQLGHTYSLRVKTRSADTFGNACVSDWSPVQKFIWGGSVPSAELVVPSAETSAFPSPWASWDYGDEDGKPQSRYEIKVDLTAVDRNVDAAVVPLAQKTESQSTTSTLIPTPTGGWEVGRTYYVSVRPRVLLEHPVMSGRCGVRQRPSPTHPLRVHLRARLRSIDGTRR